MIPGELFIQDGEIELNAGRKTVTLSVANTGDRPIQVGSHYHFFETNPALEIRPQESPRHAARHRRRHRRPLRARPDPRRPPRRTRRKTRDLRFSRRGAGQAVERAAMEKVAKDKIEIGIVLQGGGALGAYEFGAITALLELMDEIEHCRPDGAAGRGNRSFDRRDQCGLRRRRQRPGRRAKAPAVPVVRSVAGNSRSCWAAAASRNRALFGVPGFYAPREPISGISSTGRTTTTPIRCSER